MSDIALYNLLKRIPDATDAEIKEAVADIASSKGIATKSDIKELKAETKADITELKAATKVDIKDMATKADIKEVKAEIAEVKAEIAKLRTETKAEIAELKGRMLGIQWALGLIFLMNAAILAKLFF